MTGRHALSLAKKAIAMTSLRSPPHPARPTPGQTGTTSAPGEPSLSAGQGPKPPEDSVEGCRAHAAVDLAHASTLGTSNARRKYERSAASWTERADLLQRVIDHREIDARLA